MLKSLATLACISSVLLVSACLEEGDGSETSTDPESTPAAPSTPDPTSPDPTQEWCPNNTYVGNVEGLPGTARLAYEVGLNVIYVGGEITTDYAHYYFSGCELYRDMYTGMPTNNVCFVDVVGAYTGERFRAEMQFYQVGSERGFYFTSNAYEGAYSTSYNFICQ